MLQRNTRPQNPETIPGIKKKNEVFSKVIKDRFIFYGLQGSKKKKKKSPATRNLVLIFAVLLARSEAETLIFNGNVRLLGSTERKKLDILFKFSVFKSRHLLSITPYASQLQSSKQDLWHAASSFGVPVSRNLETDLTGR